MAKIFVVIAVLAIAASGEYFFLNFFQKITLSAVSLMVDCITILIYIPHSIFQSIYGQVEYVVDFYVCSERNSRFNKILSRAEKKLLPQHFF